MNSTVHGVHVHVLVSVQEKARSCRARLATTRGSVYLGSARIPQRHVVPFETTTFFSATTRRLGATHGGGERGVGRCPLPLDARTRHARRLGMSAKLPRLDDNGVHAASAHPLKLPRQPAMKVAWASETTEEPPDEDGKIYFFVITERNTDARRYKMIEGEREKVNYTIHYEIDDEEVGTVLRTSEYGGDEDMAWVLLASLPADGEDP